jgi:hypothetical protein
MPTDDSTQLFYDIAADVATSLDYIGGIIVDQIKEDLSVPVEILTGPRGGRIVVRSKPGEHPRKETGLLQSQVEHRVERDGVNSTLVVFDPVYYSAYLDPGLNRPIVTGIDERFEDKVAQAVADAVSGTPS